MAGCEGIKEGSFVIRLGPGINDALSSDLSRCSLEVAKAIDTNYPRPTLRCQPLKSAGVDGELAHRLRFFFGFFSLSRSA